MTALYDKIGGTYSAGRRSDPRIAGAIERAVAGCDSILNVGAGTGSYEPSSRFVVAVERSRTMIGQRPLGAAPVVQGCAEALPFADCSFEAVLGILTVHHWKDQGRGLSECVRVARTKVVLLTNDFDVCANFWLFDYFPELLRADRRIFPHIARFEHALGSLETIVVPVPADCRDGFLGAYWKRPNAYLDPVVRKNISTFSKIGNIDSQLARLENDIVSGAWERRYDTLMGLEVLDLGYRILISHVARRL
ncbi:MAG TPA: methyltransferase domain-containing protein [Bradyrhizobium sp.]|nr:methyltransferase domain-containing protein [Bradyrhizobium sp.]